MGLLVAFSLVGAVVPNRPWTTIRHGPLGLLRTRLRRPGDNGPYHPAKINYRKVRGDDGGLDEAD